LDKVFDEGLKDAEAMVIVVSTNSVDKPWVKEELSAGFVKRIEGRCKLIPVIIDDVEIPEALRSTVYQRILDLNDYEAELDRIVRAIFDDRNQPALGDPPGYARTIALPGLYPTDTRVLQVAGDIALETNQQLVASQDVLERVEPEGIGEEALLESLQVLEEQGFVDVAKTMARGIAGMSAFTITLFGLEKYATAFVPGYDELTMKVIAQLVNGSERTDGGIAREIDTTRLLVEHVLDMLDAQGLVRLTKMSGPTTYVFDVSPQLVRLLQEGQ
jgi:hypothetical protein